MSLLFVEVRYVNLVRPSVHGDPPPEKPSCLVNNISTGNRISAGQAFSKLIIKVIGLYCHCFNLVFCFPFPGLKKLFDINLTFICPTANLVKTLIPPKHIYQFILSR